MTLRTGTSILNCWSWIVVTATCVLCIWNPVSAFTTADCGKLSLCSSKSQLLSSEKNDNDDGAQNDSKIRFLGKGPNAIVRPGCVLIAPQDEYHHFYRQSAIFIYAMGQDDEGAGEESEYIIRGAIIDHPTPFTVGEMMEKSATPDSNPLTMNLIYRGGDKGTDNIFMLHNQPKIGNGVQIGTSGIYEGGWQAALDACASSNSNTENYKFFFNYCEFTESELESILSENTNELYLEDDWISVELPPSMVLNCEWDRGDCWKQVRNAMREKIMPEEAEEEDCVDPYE